MGSLDSSPSSVSQCGMSSIIDMNAPRRLANGVAMSSLCALMLNCSNPSTKVNQTEKHSKKIARGPLLSIAMITEI